MSWSLPRIKCRCASSGVVRTLWRSLKVLGGLPPCFLGVNDGRRGGDSRRERLYFRLLMNILFIGDIFASGGRGIVADQLNPLITEHKVDLAIANAENSAGGF